ncbi:AhpC/TSA family protein [Sesbania bispinosa]|nr:AhpC/TSA family protein [Sesbania bispinosa]
MPILLMLNVLYSTFGTPTNSLRKYQTMTAAEVSAQLPSEGMEADRSCLLGAYLFVVCVSDR